MSILTGVATVQHKTTQTSTYVSLINIESILSSLWKPEFYVNDIITALVVCKKLTHVINQLTVMVIYYCPLVYFVISS